MLLHRNNMEIWVEILAKYFENSFLEIKFGPIIHLLNEITTVIWAGCNTKWNEKLINRKAFLEMHQGKLVWVMTSSKLNQKNITGIPSKLNLNQESFSSILVHLDRLINLCTLLNYGWWGFYSIMNTICLSIQIVKKKKSN